MACQSIYDLLLVLVLGYKISKAHVLPPHMLDTIFGINLMNQAIPMVGSVNYYGIVIKDELENI